VASLLYFIHTMFRWSYTIDHYTFVVPRYRLESLHMSVVKLLTEYSYCSSRSSCHEQKENGWISLKKKLVMECISIISKHSPVSTLTGQGL